MKPFVCIFVFVMLAGHATAEETLSAPIAGLQPFLCKTWKGDLTGSGKPSIDVARWERALNGTAIRILHSVNNGEYGGESIIFFDKKKNSVAYYYFTTAGFYTNGTMKVEPGKYTAHEYVTGSSEGITEVKSTAQLTPEGQMITKSQYLKNGKWVDGHSATYTNDPSASVVFK